MSNWSKEDRTHFNESEIMQELEKGLLDTVRRAQILNDKIAQQMNITKDVTEGTKKLNEFNKALDITAQKLKNLADDEESETMDDEDLEDDELSAKARKEILFELRKMADKAIAQGLSKIAYDIERTIDEMNEVEVLCD